jgi:hypothetical protein
MCIRHPKEGHFHLALHQTLAFHSAHRNWWPTLIQAFWVQQETRGNVKVFRIEGVLLRGCSSGNCE